MRATKETKIYDLPCYGRQKSFYGKAQVIEQPDGSKELQSYNTIVAKITKRGKFIRLWGGESQTTMRHVESFLKHFGLEGGGVAWWRKQPIKA